MSRYSKSVSILVASLAAAVLVTAARPTAAPAKQPSGPSGIKFSGIKPVVILPGSNPISKTPKFKPIKPIVSPVVSPIVSPVLPLNPQKGNFHCHPHCWPIFIGTIVVDQDYVCGEHLITVDYVKLFYKDEQGMTQLVGSFSLPEELNELDAGEKALTKATRTWWVEDVDGHVVEKNPNYSESTTK